MAHDALPPKPSRGDPIRLPAGFMANLIDLVKQSEHPEATAAALSNVHGSPEPLIIRVKNTTDVDLERYEAIRPDFTTYGAWVSQWVDGSGWEWKRLSTADRPLFDGGTPSYRHWGICQEPIKAGGIGKVVVRGYTLAKITIRRDAEDDLMLDWSHVDIHPDPTGDRETYRLSLRTHGRGLVCGVKTRNRNPGEGEDSYIAPIWIDAQPGIARIYRKETEFDTPPNNIYVREHNDFGPGIDETDPIGAGSRLKWPDSMGYLPGVGLDDISAVAAEPGIAIWENRLAHGSGYWRVVYWPPCYGKLQELWEYGKTTSGGSRGNPWAEVKLITGPGDSGAYGPTFEIQANIPHRPTGFTDTRVFSVYAKSGAVVAIDPFGDIAVEPGQLNAPFGSLKAYWDVYMDGTGPCDGWYWCDGASHPDAPDFNGRFLVGQGTGDPYHETDPYPAHGSGAFGGEAIHGDAHNDHDDHAIVSHTISKATIYPAGGVATEVVTDVVPNNHSTGGLDFDDPIEHSETDNEPRWAAVAWAIRLPEPPDE